MQVDIEEEPDGTIYEFCILNSAPTITLRSQSFKRKENVAFIFTIVIVILHLLGRGKASRLESQSLWRFVQTRYEEDVRRGAQRQLVFQPKKRLLWLVKHILPCGEKFWTDILSPKLLQWVLYQVSRRSGKENHAVALIKEKKDFLITKN